MVSASASGGSASYAYDLFGRRLEKLPSGGNTIMLQYAGLSPSLLLSENDLHSNQADYIYLNGRPIGEVNPSAGNLYYTHTDALGTPQYLTNGSQTVVWSATYKAFGNTQSTAGSIVQNLRLPGQYYDTETGYHNNGFRVYDPSTTRNVSSDPIGLAGGINTYQYVRGNPFKNTDPMGLMTGIADPVTEAQTPCLAPLTNPTATNSPATNPLAWLDPQTTYDGVAQIAAGIGYANAAVGDEPGAIIAFSFAAMMEIQNSFSLPAWQTAVGEGSDWLFSTSFDSFGTSGQVTGWAFQTFVTGYTELVAPLFANPAPPSVTPVPPPKN
jgi:RHS repeat-associated protein